MASPLTKLSLSELYARKITKSVADLIIKKDDFSKISTEWCSKACTLSCKNPSNLSLNNDKADVLIIQDYKAFDDIKFNKPGDRIERTNRSILTYIARTAFTNQDITFKVTDLMKCQIQRGDLKKGKAPTDVTIQKCKPYLLNEIERLKPKVIISLCTSVTKALGLKASNYSDRGDITQYKGIPVVISLHPRILLMLRQNSSGKFWGPDFYSVILRDFKKATSLIKGEYDVPNLDEAITESLCHIRIARTIEQVQEFTKELTKLGLGNSVLSYDTETTSLDPQAENAKLLTAQFGYRDPETGFYKAIVFPLWHRENKGYIASEAWKYIAPILLEEKIKKIGHNMKFDVLYTYFTTGVRIKGVLFDTMLLLHSVNSGLQGMYGLKRAVIDWLPETGLAGYEDKLPKLTKIKEEDVEGEEEDDEQD